jgi:hypothetical protein
LTFPAALAATGGEGGGVRIDPMPLPADLVDLDKRLDDNLGEAAA